MFDLICHHVGILTIGIVAGLVLHATLMQVVRSRAK
jgi:hypothetical protein